MRELKILHFGGNMQKKNKKSVWKKIKDDVKTGRVIIAENNDAYSFYIDLGYRTTSTQYFRNVLCVYVCKDFSLQIQPVVKTNASIYWDGIKKNVVDDHHFYKFCLTCKRKSSNTQIDAIVNEDRMQFILELDNSSVK